MTDKERFEFLESGGYLPYGFKLQSDYAAAVDSALAHGNCPAYWRDPENDLEIEANTPPNGNGLVLVKPGDRDRIDQCIASRRK